MMESLILDLPQHQHAIQLILVFVFSFSAGKLRDTLAAIRCAVIYT
jgi:hypothetical protein